VSVKDHAAGSQEHAIATEIVALRRQCKAVVKARHDAAADAIDARANVRADVEGEGAPAVPRPPDAVPSSQTLVWFDAGGAPVAYGIERYNFDNKGTPTVAVVVRPAFCLCFFPHSASQLVAVLQCCPESIFCQDESLLSRRPGLLAGGVRPLLYVPEEEVSTDTAIGAIRRAPDDHIFPATVLIAFSKEKVAFSSAARKAAAARKKKRKAEEAAAGDAVGRGRGRGGGRGRGARGAAAGRGRGRGRGGRGAKSPAVPIEDEEDT